MSQLLNVILQGHGGKNNKIYVYLRFYSAEIGDRKGKILDKSFNKSFYDAQLLLSNFFVRKRSAFRCVPTSQKCN